MSFKENKINDIDAQTILLPVISFLLAQKCN